MSFASRSVRFCVSTMVHVTKIFLFGFTCLLAKTEATSCKVKTLESLVNDIIGTRLYNNHGSLILIGNFNSVNEELNIFKTTVQNYRSIENAVNRSADFRTLNGIIVIGEIVKSEDAESLEYVARYQANSVVIGFGSLDETTIMFDVQAHDKHFIYVKTTDICMYEIFVFCAGQAQKGALRVNVFKINSFVLKRNVLRSCPPVLYDRLVRFSINMFSPHITRNGSGGIDGIDYKISQDLAQAFKSKASYRIAAFVPIYNESDLTGNSAFALVRSQRVDMAIGGRCVYATNLNFVDMTNTLTVLRSAWVTAIPRRVDSYFKILNVLHWKTWSWVYATLTVFVLALTITFYVYKYVLAAERNLVIRSHVPVYDLIILPFTQFAEPHPLSWFPRHSSGRFLTILWSIFTLFIIWFFCSNLRATFAKANYEEKIDSSAQLLKSNRPVYISSIAAKYNIHDPQLAPHVSRIDRELALRAESIPNGRFSSQKYGSFPEFVRKAMKEEGAAMPFSEESLLYDYLNNKKYGFRSYVSSTEKDTYQCGFYLKKNSPLREEVNNVLGWITAFGLPQKYKYDPIPLEAREQWTPGMEIAELAPLMITDVAVLLFSLMVLLILSTLVFVAEILAAKAGAKEKWLYVTWKIEPYLQSIIDNLPKF